MQSWLQRATVGIFWLQNVEAHVCYTALKRRLSFKRVNHPLSATDGRSSPAQWRRMNWSGTRGPLGMRPWSIREGGGLPTRGGDGMGGGRVWPSMLTWQPVGLVGRLVDRFSQRAILQLGAAADAATGRGRIGKFLSVADPLLHWKRTTGLHYACYHFLQSYSCPTCTPSCLVALILQLLNP